MIAETTSSHQQDNANPNGRPKRWTQEVCDNLADELSKWVMNEDKLFIKEFCIEYDFLPTEYHELIAASKKFSKAFNRAKAILEVRLSRCAMTGKHKEHFTKFLMMNLHGYVDRSESKVTSEGKVNVSITSYSTQSGIDLKASANEIDITPTFSQLDHKSSDGDSK